ncbi:peptidase M3 [bacterium]|nr:peptidase M3 [bacterium]
MSLLSQLNNEYLELHVTREDSFWQSKMGLSEYVQGSMEAKDKQLKKFISDASWLPKIRKELDRNDLSSDEKTGLEGWLAFFNANAIESEEGKAIMNEIIDLEGELSRRRRSMKLGYTDPVTKEFTEASSPRLSLMILTGENDQIRKAAWEGLRSIEKFSLENGLIEIFKKRNELGRALGYRDFYDYRVQVNEGFSKEKLFELLDELEVNTREACKKYVEGVKAEKGAAAIEPWNFDNATGGDLTAQKDPYIRFEAAFDSWVRSFSAMNISYSDATLTLDLVDRKGKYENGFMHGPEPSWIEDNKHHSARINFTANAVPGQMGSGMRAMQTLFHEGGHAAHFSNIKMPAPCFAQEFAPTSIAFAETQSMFLDSLLNDADWLTRYALDEDGNPMPIDLIRRDIEHTHRNRAHYLRRMMTVPYFEKKIYELSDDEMTPERILEIARETEKQFSFQDASGRPLLSIPHLLESDSSAYYHAYVLATMAVYQTRAFFMKRDGFIMDNPKIGNDLANIYWKPGNSKNFLQLVEELTGEPFSAKASIELVTKSLDQVFDETAASIENEKNIPSGKGALQLDATIRIIHGDELLGESEVGNENLEALADKYAVWLKKQV